MNTTSLELSRKLFELSGWGDANWCHNTGNGKTVKLEEELHADDWPLYDLDYLTRKLPSGCYVTKQNDIYDDSEYFLASCIASSYEFKANSPENALCLLAIKLFEDKVIGL